MAGIQSFGLQPQVHRHPRPRPPVFSVIRGLLEWDGQSRDGDIRLLLFQVEGDHLGDVHAVDVVGPEHQVQLRMLMLDQVEVLMNGIRGALEPVVTSKHLWWDHGDGMVREQRRDGPGLAMCSMSDWDLY